MALKTSNKRDPNFSMSSLTDIIFLLLIFFMLTSTFVTPSALDLTLPSSSSQVMANKGVSVQITRNMEYYVEGERVRLNQLQTSIEKAVKKEENPTIILQADKATELEKVVGVMNIVKKMNLKMVLATEPTE